MAKLVFVSAFLVVALLAVAAEASFRTIITATVDEESQWGERGQQPQRCQQQIQQRRQQLRQCEQMMSQQGRRSDMDMESTSQHGQQQQQRQCCQGLENLDRQCRCQAVNQMVQDMMQRQGQGQGQGQSEMMDMARHLPDMCNLEPRQCQIQSPSFITTIADEESQQGERGQQPQRCQQQIQQRRQQLRQCEQMMSQQGRRSDQDMELTSQHGQQQQQRQCCQGLENLDRQCRCEAVNQMVQDMMQGQGHGQGGRQSEMMDMARHLPDMCNLEPRQCQIQSPSFITTVVDEESQMGGREEQPQRCQQQIQKRRQQLRQCEQMLSQQGSRSDMEMINKYGQGGEQQQQQRQCCQGLENLDRQCRCEAVNQMVQDMMQGQERSRHASRQSEMIEKARYLPDMCNLEPRQCQIQSPCF